MDVFVDRLSRVRAQMAEESILFIPAQAPCIRNHDTNYPYRASSDILYLTGVNEEELSILLTHEEVHIFALGRDAERERWMGPVKGHEFYRNLFSSLKKVFIHEPKDLEKNLQTLLVSKKLLYFNFGADAVSDALVFKTLNGIRQKARRGVLAPQTITRSSLLLEECRLFKDVYDLECMRKAAAISSNAHNKVIEYIESRKTSASEFTLKALIEHEFMVAGADRLAYPSIVAAGKNATILHYEATQSVAELGDFVLIDAGCEYKGYASDITRTTLVGGNGSALKKDIYALVLEAQRVAIQKSVAGNSIESVHESAVDILSRGLLGLGFFKSVPLRTKDKEEDAKTLVDVTSLDEIKEREYYNLFYMHRTSHYMGLDVHDVGNYFVEGKSRALQKGMVITVEPGLYFPVEYSFIRDEAHGIGVRIEDDVLILDQGNEVLTAQCRK